MRQNPAAKVLGLVGLIIMAGGGLFYAISVRQAIWGLAVAGLGLLVIVVAAVLARRQLAEMSTRRSARLGLGSGVAILVALALAIFLGSLAERHHLRWDLSQGGIYTLAPQTVKVLKNLKQPVKAYAFFKDTQAGRQQAEEELAKYAFVSRKFTYQFINPDTDPGMAKRFEIRNYGEVVLVSGKKEERVQLPEEQALTNALIRLGRQGKKTVYFISGHGEPALDGVAKNDISSFKKAIEQNNYTVKNLMLATSSQVPPDASAVILAGPKKALMPQEIERLGAYLAGGGSLLILLNPDSDAGLKDWLKERGVLVDNDLVLDTAATLMGLSALAPVVTQYGFHQITEPMAGLFCFFPEARSVSLAAKLPSNVTGTDLVKTSSASWATGYLAFVERYKRATQQGAESKMELKPVSGDKKGPISLGAVVSITEPKPKDAPQDAPQPKARMVVFGDSDFVNNQFLELAGNRDLAMNSVAWLAEEEDQISIRAKKRANQPLMLQPGQARLLFWLPVVAWPLLIAVVGAVVIIRRRRSA